MPFYVSLKSLEARYSEGTVNYVGDADDDNSIDADRLEAALRDAEGEVNSYVGKVYSLPLEGVTDRVDPELNTNVPEMLPRIVTDVAMYRMRPSGDLVTEESRVRYKDAIKWLEMVASRKVVLYAETLAADALNTARSTRVTRVLSRRSMRGLL